MSTEFHYAGMDLGNLVVWILLTTIAGLVARQILQGKSILALWGDMAIGIIGVFALGWVMRQLNFDLSQTILTAQPNLPSSIAIWADVFVTAFLGALVLRLALRLVKQ